MNIVQRLISRFSSKESQARAIASMRLIGQPAHTPANFMGFTREGYQKNAIVFRCVSIIAQACAGIDLKQYSGKGKARKEIEDSPLLTLLDNPNPLQGGPALTEAAIAYLLLTGNTYLNPTKISSRMGKIPVELWVNRPDFMKVKVGQKGYPAAYIYDQNGQKYEWPVDQVTFKSDIIHMKTFHPNNDWYGMSRLEAAMLSLDQANAGSRWNLAMLQNSATPSGVLQMKDSASNPGGQLTNEQYKRLKSEFDENYMGSKNAGRPMLLEGGLTWQSISLSPRDMDWVKGKEMTAMDIAMVFGVPGEILGLGQKTYANYEEARCALYEDTILPLMDFYTGELNRQLTGQLADESNSIGYNMDDVEALEYKRAKKYTSLGTVNFLTQNEKREAVGKAPVEGMDVFVIGSKIVDPTDPESMKDPAPFGGGKPNDENQPGENPDENGPSGTGPKKVPKAPKADDEEDDTKGWKSLNLLNRNERAKSYRRQNARRKRLIAPFERDLENDLLNLSRAISDAAKGINDARLAEMAMLKAADDNMDEVQRTLQKHIRYTAEDFGNMVINEAKSAFNMETKATNRRFEDFLNAYVKNRTGRAITQIEGTTKKQVRTIVSRLVQDNLDAGDTNVDLSNDLRSEFDTLSKGRARTIARTEVTMASSNASLNAVKSLQVPGLVKEWNSIDDDRTRDGDGPNHGDAANHLIMNGATALLDEKFIVPPDTEMDSPGDENGGADQVCNCRCVLTYKQASAGD